VYRNTTQNEIKDAYRKMNLPGNFKEEEIDNEEGYMDMEY